MSLILDGSNGITFPNSSTQSVGFYGFKNRIINGGMVIDQRNAGASVTPTTAGTYLVDRWVVYPSQNSKLTAQQNAGSVTPPAGFINYLGFTSSSAYSILSSDYFVFGQKIEGFNTADLGWGTANAKTVTLSFWVYSSLTGTFGGAFTNSAENRSYPFSYTISSANTWTQISITVAGDTTGTWLTNNSSGIKIYFSLGVGSTYTGTAGSWAGANYYNATGATSVVGTNGATFYITAVQLEAGSTATSFDYRPYGTELNLCQRYYQRPIDYTQYGSTNFGAFSSGAVFSSAGSAYGVATLPVAMRAIPSVSTSGCYFNAINGNTTGSLSFTVASGQSLSSSAAGVNSIYLIPSWTTGAAGVANQFCWIQPNATAGNFLAFSSEL